LRKERGLRVFENMVVRRIFGPKRDVLTGEWRKLRNEGINHLFSSPNIIWVIKSRRMKWVGHVAPGGGGDLRTGLWWGNLKDRDLWE